MKSDHIDSKVPSLIAKQMDLLVCPVCGGTLGASLDGLMLNCSKCNRSFRCENGIPLLFWPNEWERSTSDVTDSIRTFYEDNPFPNYEDLDTDWSLREKAEKGIFARMLDHQIPYQARILEVGCGTGQLSNFLGLISGRTVFGADICLNSLKLGQAFRERNHIGGTAFLQMNLFRPVFKAETFDVVICNGVLHHTSDPFLGFQSISRLVKPGGFVMVGFYNTFGRIPTKIRKYVFHLTGNRFKFLDSRLREKNLSDTRKHTWFMDQYKNPHESTHTFGEILRWFSRTGFEFMSSVPPATAFESFSEQERLFEAHSKGTRIDHFFAQLGLLFTGDKEGGFFVMIGRRAS
ncbi:MAG: methyltransferase domain-containing protein [Chloroflexota bacterium]